MYACVHVLLVLLLRFSVISQARAYIVDRRECSIVWITTKDDVLAVAVTFGSSGN